MITEAMLRLKVVWPRLDEIADDPNLPPERREALESLLQGFEDQTVRIIALQGIVTGLLGETMTKQRARELASEINEQEIAVLKAARGETQKQKTAVP